MAMSRGQHDDAAPRLRLRLSWQRRFMAITGGINWEDAYEPLREVSLMALWLMNLPLACMGACYFIQPVRCISPVPLLPLPVGMS